MINFPLSSGNEADAVCMLLTAVSEEKSKVALTIAILKAPPPTVRAGASHLTQQDSFSSVAKWEVCVKMGEGAEFHRSSPKTTYIEASSVSVSASREPCITSPMPCSRLLFLGPDSRNEKENTRRLPLGPRVRTFPHYRSRFLILHMRRLVLRVYVGGETGAQIVCQVDSQQLAVFKNSDAVET